MFVINSTRINGETVTTNVTFTLNDDTPLTIDVPHFMPQSAEDVLQGIRNREASEQVKYDAEIVNAQVVNKLSQFVGVPQGA